jgi:hypothetical protein
MNARIRTVWTLGIGNAARSNAPPAAALRWLDERVVAAVSFRLRLLKMAFRPVDRIPALVVMALESPDREANTLLDPDQSSAGIGSVR